MSLSETLRAALLAVADPARAPAMEAYMKSAMPYMGVPSLAMRAVSKTMFTGLHYEDSAAWQADILDIWRNSRFREEYYAAIEPASAKQARKFQRMDALPLYREMIIGGGWWDTTDAIAPNRLFDILVADRPAMTQAMLAWAKDDNIWIRRSAILCQMKAKARMDLDLLYACIEPSITSKEFFLRKAIGWVLRHYARTNPDEVRRYVAANDARMSSLSKREALKHIG
jgi:3-methyladenine DNA glycosylase AlkD